MLSPVSSSSSALPPLGGSVTGGQAMDKEAFLKLLVAQMKNQDPLQPMENTEFVAQLATFSNVEQAMGINERLDLLATMQQGLANTGITSLVGKSVAVRGSVVSLGSSGAAVPVTFSLGAASTETTVTIRDQAGNVVRTLQAGARPAGQISVSWDGRNDAGLVQPAGAYSVSVAAKDAAGASIDVVQEATGVVKSVSFDKGYAALTLDNGLSVPASDLIRVTTP